MLPDVNCQLRGFHDDVDVFSQMISPVHGFFVFRATDQIVHHLRTLIGMFNAWVWSLAIVTAKVSCTRSPWIRVNGMFNAFVWSFAFDLRDMSNEE